MLIPQPVSLAELVDNLKLPALIGGLKAGLHLRLDILVDQAEHCGFSRVELRVECAGQRWRVEVVARG